MNNEPSPRKFPKRKKLFGFRDYAQTGSPAARLLKIAVSILKTHSDTQRRCHRLAKLAVNQGRGVEEIAAALTAKINIPEAHALSPGETIRVENGIGRLYVATAGLGA